MINGGGLTIVGVGLASNGVGVGRASNGVGVGRASNGVGVGGFDASVPGVPNPAFPGPGGTSSCAGIGKNCGTANGLSTGSSTGLANDAPSCNTFSCGSRAMPDGPVIHARRAAVVRERCSMTIAGEPVLDRLITLRRLIAKMAILQRGDQRRFAVAAAEEILRKARLEAEAA